MLPHASLFCIVNRGVLIHRITITNTKITVQLNIFYSEHREKNKGIKVIIDHKINELKIPAYVIQHLSQHKTVIYQFMMCLVDVSASTWPSSGRSPTTEYGNSRLYLKTCICGDKNKML
jgi:hypothetical protein